MSLLIPLGLVALLLLIFVHDRYLGSSAILRNFPVVGRFRSLLTTLGPKLRQYIVAGNDEERPFSRDQRHWIATSADASDNYFGFGTDTEQEQVESFLIVKHSAFPLVAPHPGREGYDADYPIPSRKVLGGYRKRSKAFRPQSVVNISGMSYGSLSSAAVEALNRGAEVAGCLHNTGEGGVSPYHLSGGDLIWQIGTGYFGCRNPDGSFSLERCLETVASGPIRALEIKLSQGAKPGLGGVLPAAKITSEIARIRGIEQGEDCISPASHSAFSDVSSLLDFVEYLAEATGLPVGIKSAVGQEQFWIDLAREIETSGRAVDFVTIDGGEGGTGAGPLAFTDHVSLPFKLGFSRVYSIFAERGVADRVIWNGSGKLGFPETALLAFAMGCDLVSIAREPMLAIGCIQAQKCHTGHCPTGVATHKRWLVGGLDPDQEYKRLANYLTALRKELLRLSRACGVDHPSKVSLDLLEILDGQLGHRSARETFGYEASWGGGP